MTVHSRSSNGENKLPESIHISTVFLSFLSGVRLASIAEPPARRRAAGKSGTEARLGDIAED
jgi:hypothetical protein